MSYPAGGNFLRLNCGVKRWVYISAATKLCCSGALLCGALLCGAVLLRFCSSPLLELQHELLHHGLHCGVKQWVYTSVATKLCCTVALRRIEEKASRFSAGMNPTLPFTLHQSMAQRDIPR